jgi:hypothetical protein
MVYERLNECFYLGVVYRLLIINGQSVTMQLSDENRSFINELMLTDKPNWLIIIISIAYTYSLSVTDSMKYKQALTALRFISRKFKRLVIDWRHALSSSGTVARSTPPVGLVVNTHWLHFHCDNS